MKSQLIKLFQRLNEEFPPQINEYGIAMRHAIVFDTDTQELILSINLQRNGTIVFQSFELDDGDLENIDKLIAELAYLLTQNDR